MEWHQGTALDIYRSMKVMGKDTFRDIQTNPPDLDACLHHIYAFPAFHLLCVATSSPVHWCLCLCQAQAAAELHWGQRILTYKPLSHSPAYTQTLTDTLKNMGLGFTLKQYSLTNC